MVQQIHSRFRRGQLLPLLSHVVSIKRIKNNRIIVFLIIVRPVDNIYQDCTTQMVFIYMHSDWIFALHAVFLSAIQAQNYIASNFFASLAATDLFVELTEVLGKFPKRKSCEIAHLLKRYVSFEQPQVKLC